MAARSLARAHSPGLTYYDLLTGAIPAHQPHAVSVRGTARGKRYDAGFGDRNTLGQWFDRQSFTVALNLEIVGGRTIEKTEADAFGRRTNF
jgi:hypothetical protein